MTVTALACLCVFLLTRRALDRKLDRVHHQLAEQLAALRLERDGLRTELWNLRKSGRGRSASGVGRTVGGFERFARAQGEKSRAE